jgi:hypothetical protein
VRTQASAPPGTSAVALELAQNQSLDATRQGPSLPPKHSTIRGTIHHITKKANDELPSPNPGILGRRSPGVIMLTSFRAFPTH